MLPNNSMRNYYSQAPTPQDAVKQAQMEAQKREYELGLPVEVQQRLRQVRQRDFFIFAALGVLALVILTIYVITR
jgi:type II secretory pathway component PulM